MEVRHLCVNGKIIFLLIVATKKKMNTSKNDIFKQVSEHLLHLEQMMPLKTNQSVSVVNKTLT